MKQILIFLVLSLSVLTLALSQVPSDRTALLNGEEGTQAKVAETLGYPSPKNILDQASTLRLSDVQRKSLNEIYIESVSRAKDLGKQIVKIEEELHDALQTGFVNEKSLADDAQQIGRLRGRLRGVFLTAHYNTKKVLTSIQLEMWKKSGLPEGKK
jgi:hypothetical protein